MDAQRKDMHCGSRRCLLDNGPALTTLERPPRAVKVAFAREKERLVIGKTLFFCPEQQLAG